MSRKKNILIYIFLFAFSFAIRLYDITQDHFLNTWDEQFHAMGAKNMMTHPFTPMLYANPVLPYDYKNWIGNHIWLHKQPLFLWQAALSMKLFGANEVAMRLPSAILSSLLVLIVFRIGIIISGFLIGFIASLLMMTNQFHLLQVSGAMGMDHNDVSFMVYVTFSIWAWLEYEISKKNFWLVLIGLFAGCAVLCKWLTGLLVFYGWGISSLFIRRDFFKEKNWWKMFFSFGVCLLVFLPWQFYIFLRFPNEAQYEISTYSKHFTEVVEGCEGDFWFHFSWLPMLYFQLCWLIPLGMISLYFKAKEKWMWVSFLLMVVTIYLFFSLAMTKLIPLTVLVMPLNFIFIASIIDTVISALMKTGIKWLAYSLSAFILAGILFLNFNYKMFDDFHRLDGTRNGWANNYSGIESGRATIYKRLKSELPNNYVIVNCPDRDEISCMFYSDKTSYGMLSPNNIRFIKDRGFRIATFKAGATDELLSDSSVLIIPFGEK